jgi:hypothetical protein
MKNLFDPAVVPELTGRIAQLTPTSQRQWGKMTVSQALAHCCIGFESATGAQKPARMLVGRFLGPIIKPLALGNDDPIRKNTPTAPVFVVSDDRDFQPEQANLVAWVVRFNAEGPKACTNHPHAFFGQMTPDEWAILMYKHVDHHLRQFGV